jgi:hypothetical protein
VADLVRQRFDTARGGGVTFVSICDQHTRVREQAHV